MITTERKGDKLIIRCDGYIIAAVYDDGTVE